MKTCKICLFFFYNLVLISLTVILWKFQEFETPPASERCPLILFTLRPLPLWTTVLAQICLLQSFLEEFSSSGFSSKKIPGGSHTLLKSLRQTSTGLSPGSDSLK